MCRIQNNLEVVVALSGSRFIGIPIDVTWINESGGGINNILEILLVSKGFADITAILPEPEREVLLMLGVRCRVCNEFYPVGGCFSVYVPNLVHQAVQLVELKKRGINYPSVFSAMVGILILEMIHDLFDFLNEEDTAIFFGDEQDILNLLNDRDESVIDGDPDLIWDRTLQDEMEKLRKINPDEYDADTNWEDGKTQRDNTESQLDDDDGFGFSLN